MGAVLRAGLVLLGLLAVTATALVAAGTQGQVTLNTPGMVVSVALPVALVGALVVLVLAYYLGQTMMWLGGLPNFIRRLRGRRQRGETLEGVTAALVKLRLGERKVAAKMAHRLTPGAAETPVVETLGMLLDTATLPDLDRMTADPVRAPLARLMLARRAAKARDWERVKELTSQGLAGASESPRLLALHLKALLNLNETAAAGSLLPQLKQSVSSRTMDLLTTAVQGPLRPEVAAPLLKHPWFERFKAWLGTPDDELPDA